MKPVKIIVAVFILLLIAGGIYFIYSMKQQNDKTLTLYGNVDIRDVALGFRVAGKLTDVLYEEGDYVKAGQVLAKLDNEPYDEELAVANSELIEAQAELKNSQRSFERYKNLLATKDVSQADYDRELKNRDIRRAIVNRIKNHIIRLQTYIDDTILMAPSNGVILTRVREPGSIVQVGEPVITMTVNNETWVRTFIAEPDLGKIHPGMPVEIYTDSQPDAAHPGTVGYISPQAEFTPKNVETRELRTDLVYRVRVVIANPSLSLRQGMPVTVKIHLPDAQRQ